MKKNLRYFMTLLLMMVMQHIDLGALVVRVYQVLTEPSIPKLLWALPFLKWN